MTLLIRFVFKKLYRTLMNYNEKVILIMLVLFLQSCKRKYQSLDLKAVASDEVLSWS